MLMGEYDFTDNFVETNTFWLSKVIFVVFVLDMSIVLMNLVIGLAVNDVDSIKRESNVQRLMNEAYTVMYLEQVLIILQGCSKGRGRGGSLADQTAPYKKH